MDEEISYIIKHIFKTRLHRKLGHLLTHNLGLVISGPPGTGKTLLSNALVENWRKSGREVVVTTLKGSEVFSELVGKAEERVRKLFKPAEDEWANAHESERIELRTHLFLIDEMDAMLPVRGSDTNKVGDRVVATFLAIIDGTLKLKNVFVVGTTNRREMIDPAVLRAGRLGLHIETKALERSE